MNDASDLLADYRRTGSETAFSELTRRYANLVYSVANRRLSNTSLAEDATQSVFTLLAAAPPNLSNDAQLAAWLHRTALHVSIDLWRRETRRQAREQQAYAMQPAPSDSALWEELAPELDDALNRLPDADRQAVLLRFFEGKAMREVGRVLGVSEDAAKMRVGRALERLRRRLALRGVTCPGGALAALLTARATDAAPAHLAGSLLAEKAASSCATPAAGSSLFQLITIMSKTKTTLALLAIAAAVATLISVHQARRLEMSPALESAAASRVEPSDAAASAFWRRAQPSRVADSQLSSSDDQIENAKRNLEALLAGASRRNLYPPEALNEALAAFGNRIHEAAPILIEGLAESNKQETRKWAISGLQAVLMRLRLAPGVDERVREVFALAHPTLSHILLNDTDNFVRLGAADAYIPPPGSAYRFSAVQIEDLLAAFRTTESSRRERVEGFRLALAGMLASHFRNRPEEAIPFAAVMRAALGQPDPAERFLAAYALALWPGEKPAAVTDVLIAELHSNSGQSVHAIAALRNMGAESANSIVPHLPAFAETANDEIERALKTDIDSILRLDEAPEWYRSSLQSAIDSVQALDTSKTVEGAIANARFLLDTGALTEEDRIPRIFMLLAEALEGAVDPESIDNDARLDLMTATMRRVSPDIEAAFLKWFENEMARLAE